MARRHTAAALLMLLALSGLACSSKGEGKSDRTSEQTSGGEWDEASSMARKVAPRAAAAPTATAPAAEASAPKDYSPQVKDAPPVQTSKPATSTGPSLWGAPDSESGAPLPPRAAMSSAAKSAYDTGIKESASGNLAGAKT